MYLSIYLSLSISIYLYLSLSISIYLYLSLSISIYLYLSLSISIYLYLSLSIYLSIYLIYLSIYIYIYIMALVVTLPVRCAFRSCRLCSLKAISAASKIHDLLVLPKYGWFRRESPIKLDDSGVPPFMETPIYIYTHLVCICISFHIFHHTHRLTINLTINTLQVPCFADQSPVVAAQWHRYHEGDRHQVLLIEPAVF